MRDLDECVAHPFRRGSVTENYRKCGKPNCACAQSGHPGHGPRFEVNERICEARPVAGTDGRPVPEGGLEAAETVIRAGFRSRGLFVGSGVVESGCKAVIGQRFKMMSGMRWRHVTTR